MAQTLQVGSRAPDVALDDATGARLQLASLWAQKPLVLFFYPKNGTFGCTQEVCAFRDQYADFVAAGCQVVGISGDSVASHQAFAQRHGLAYPLLSDPEGVARASFGVTRTLGLLPGRVTFVIDGAGVVRHVFDGQFNIRGHIEQALQVVRQLQAERP